jgi:hypothetical protein
MRGGEEKSDTKKPLMERPEKRERLEGLVVDERIIVK